MAGAVGVAPQTAGWLSGKLSLPVTQPTGETEQRGRDAASRGTDERQRASPSETPTKLERI